MNPEYAKRMKKIFSEVHGGENNVNAKKIICINTNEIFETMTEAANKYSLNMKNICQVCTGEKITTGGLQFAYYEGEKDYKLKSIPNHTKGGHPNARKVICINNNMIFDSVVSASEYFGVDYKAIHQNVLGKNTASLGLDGNWYQFDYYEEGKEYKLKNIRNIKTPKKVVLVNTGEIYSSTREASKKTGVSQGHISMCCNNKRQHAGKLENGEYIVWRFEDEYNPNENFSFKKRKESTYKAKKVICLTTNEIFPSITEALKRCGMKPTDSSISLVCKGKRKYAGKLQDGTPLKWEYCDEHLSN